MFSKRHYEALALLMQRIQPDPNQPEEFRRWEIMLAEMADMFTSDNHLFKRDRFERACVRGANVRARS